MAREGGGTPPFARETKVAAMKLPSEGHNRKGGVATPTPPGWKGQGGYAPGPEHGGEGVT